jgi:hypothetical protein
MAYSVPAVNIFQQFVEDTQPTDVSLNTVLIGPNQFFLDCLADAADAALGAYDLTADTVYSFPKRPAGAVVNAASVQLCFRQASLKYFPATPATDYSVPTDAVLLAHPCYTNKLYSTPTGGVNAEWIFKNGCSPEHAYSVYTEWTRSADFLNRDVAVGDLVKMRIHDSNGDVYSDEFESKVYAIEKVPMLMALGDTDSGIQDAYLQAEGTSTGAINSNVGDRFIGLVDERWELEVTASGTGTVTFLATNLVTGKTQELTFTTATKDDEQELGCNGILLTVDDPADNTVFVEGEKYYVDARVSKFDPTAPLTAGGGVNALPVIGIYSGEADITYSIEVIKDYAVGSPAQIQVRSTTGDSSGPINVPDDDVTEAWYELGTKGMYFKINSAAGIVASDLLEGQVWTITVQSKIDGPYAMMALEDEIPAAYYTLNGTQTIEIALNLLTDDLSPVTDPDVWFVNEDNTSITVKAGIAVPSSSFCDPNELTDCPDLRLDSANMYLGYTALVPGDGHLGVVYSEDNITSQVGKIIPQNTLAQGLAFALANTDRILYTDAPELATATKPIYYYAVQTNDLAGYQKALDLLSNRTDMYCLIPLTFDRTIHAAVITHVNAMSTAEKARWRITRLSAQALSEEVLYNTYLDADCTTTRDYLGTLAINPNGATLDPAQYTLLSLPGAKFITDEVAAGDLVRLNFHADPVTGDTVYDEYEIDTVLSQQTAVLVTGPTSPITDPTKIMIVRALDETAQREELMAYAASIKNRRVTLFFPDVFSYLGTEYNGYHLAAMIGGFTCTLPPQQGFTNIEVVGADDVSRTIVDFNESDLDAMAGGGIWLMTQQGRGNPVYSRHEVTTDPTNINYREDMVTRNVDAISYYFMNLLKPFIGKYNVTSETIETLRATILEGIDTLKSVRISQLGGQVLAGTSLTYLAQHTTLKDRVTAKISLSLPYPMNNIDLTLTV